MHSGLMGIDRFPMWNTHSVGDDNIDASRSSDELENLLADGGGTRAWATDQVDINWTAWYMLSAAALPDAAKPHCIWRFTPDLSSDGGDPSQFVKRSAGGGVILAGMIGSDGKTATVTIPGAAVVGGGGKQQPAASAAGVWISQPVSEGSKTCPFT